MTSTIGVGEFCRYVIDCNEDHLLDDPVSLGGIFRAYAGIKRTPTLSSTIRLVQSLGIVIDGVDYLKSGGTNMIANGCWHIHYSVNERPATRKFTILHELFEIFNKNFNLYQPDFLPLREPKMSRHADRFAASALLPPDFFLKRVQATGCDIKILSDELELSNQCVLIALGQHFSDIPFVGVLYENHLNGSKKNKDIENFIATVVVKTPKAKQFKYLCGLQSVPFRNEKARFESLVCAAITGGQPLLWRNDDVGHSPAIFVRPLISTDKEPYRVILLAVPSQEYHVISTQVDKIEPLRVNGDIPCPSETKCRVTKRCRWKLIRGVSHE